MKRCAVLLSLLAMGCGSVDIYGTWSGTITRTIRCEDGSVSSDSSVVTWPIAGQGVAYTMDTGALCGRVRLNVEGDHVVAIPVYCGRATSGPLTYDSNLTEASARVRNEQDMALSATVESDVVSGAPRQTCTQQLSGILTRQ
jgi:hypothetical protein